MLVIIGLLIGGLLIARSMIETARIQTAVRAIQQFDVAVSNFQTKYNELPGDATTFGGDGDGSIIYYDWGHLGMRFGDEIANFWVQLQQSGFNYKGKTFSPTISGMLNEGEDHTPVVRTGFDSDIIVFNNTYQEGVHNMYHFLAAKGQVDASTDIVSSMVGMNATPPFMALSIDTKIDDGRPMTGYVQANLDGKSYIVDASFYSDNVCTDLDGVGYSDPMVVKYVTPPDDTPNTCILMVELLGQVGQAQ